MPRSKRLDELLGVWAMQPDRAMRLLDVVRSIDLRLHIQNSVAAMDDDDEPRPKKPLYELRDGVAIVSICGVMTKSGAGDSMTETASTAIARHAVRRARQDAAVRGIVLYIDSPGGSSSGVDDLAAEVFAAAAEKPVVACIEDTGCSAAYYAACQARRVMANRSAFVGSIGTYMVIDDLSKMYEAKGIKTHVVKAGEYKAAGAEGTAITDEQLAEFQREVNAVNALFVAAVARGRKLSAERASELADGRAFVADEAMRMGLVDQIGSIDDAVSWIAAQSTAAVRPPESGQKRATVMAHANGEAAAPKSAYCKLPDGTEDGGMDEAGCKEAGGEWMPSEAAQASVPAARQARRQRAATLEEIKARAPGASAEFVLSCAEKAMTADDVATAYMTRLAADNEALRAKVDAASRLAAAQVPAVPVSPSASAEPMTDADALKDRWKANAALRSEFNNNFEAFSAFERNMAAGRIRIGAKAG